MKPVSIIYIVFFSILLGIVFANFHPKINQIKIDIMNIDIWNTIYVEMEKSGDTLKIKIYRGMANPLQRKYNITIVADGEKIFIQKRSIAPGQIIEIGANIPIENIKILINNRQVKIYRR